MPHITALSSDLERFPDTELALEEPNGLLAVGGDLQPQRIIAAYRQGIFPWFDETQPLLWWSPNPRMVMQPAKIHLSRSLRKTLKKQIFTITINHCFDLVINACASTRQKQSGTWITPQMEAAYIELHRIGVAHSIEAWHENKLVGGLYGLAIGRVFFGESMFSLQTDASKVAFAKLATHLESFDYELIDCQVHSHHLASLGAEEIDRKQFVETLQQLTALSPKPAAWVKHSLA